MSFLPPSSAGCALPAKMIWTGRSGLLRMRARRSTSRKMSVAREPDRQHVALEEGRGGDDLRRLVATFGPAPAGARVDEVEQLLLSGLVGGPELLVGDGAHRLPGHRILWPLPPVVRQVAVEEGGDLGRDPGREVDAVGDRGDRHQRRRHLGPEVVPHGARELAVALADAVAVAGEAHRQGGEVEAVAGASWWPSARNCSRV